MNNKASEHFNIEGPMTLRQVTLQTGLSEDTLRYYEKMGLLPAIKRDTSSNQRRYSVDNVYQAHLLAALRASGMSVKDMKIYLDNELDQHGSIDKRMELLAKQQRIVKRNIIRLNKQLSFLEKKSEHYKALSRNDAQAVRRIEKELIVLSLSLNTDIRAEGRSRQ
jgi:DNA-binding transcriptional MerR regulator